MSSAVSGPAGPATAGRCPVSRLAESFDPFTDPYLQDPYSFWATARPEEPVFFSPSLDYWIVSRYADVRQVFMDTDSFSAGISITPLRELCAAAVDELVKAQMVMGPSLVNEDPPLHTRRRKPIRDALVDPRRIAAMGPRSASSRPRTSTGSWGGDTPTSSPTSPGRSRRSWPSP